MERENEIAALTAMGLVNPDEEKEHIYQWPEEFQQRILGSLILDNYCLIQSVGLIKPQYFRENVHRLICRIILEYFEKYNGRPDPIIIATEIEERLADDSSKDYHLAELKTICAVYQPGVHKREAFLDKVTEFAKTQALRTSFNKVLGYFNSARRDKWSLIRTELEEALLVERNVDLGLEYFETIEDRYKRMMAAQESQEYFPTGFEPIDEAIGGGTCRGEIGAFAGMSGSGKSLALVKVGSSCIRTGWNVLYVTLEMDEDKVAERFDSMLTGVPIRSLYTGTNPKQVSGVLYESINHWGNLVIKQFPAGVADMTTLRAFINQIDVNGFRADVIIVDYIGEMRDTPGLKTYESRQRLVRDLRGMATELDVGVFTAMQVNRGGRDAMEERGYLDDDSLADSAGQVRPLDFLWTLSQTSSEQKANCGTLFASKHRSGRGRFLMRFQRDPNTLEMHIISQERYKIELCRVEEKTAEELVIEDLARDAWAPNKGVGDSIKHEIENKETA